MSLREFNFKSNNTQKGAHSLSDRPERIQTCTYTHVGISCKRGVICELGKEHLTSVLWGLYGHTCWVLNKTVPVVINIIFSFKDSEVILEAFIYLFVENLLTSWQQSTEEMLWQMKGFVIFKIQLAFAAFYNITGLFKNCGRDANHETCFLVRVGQTNRGTVSTWPQQ